MAGEVENNIQQLRRKHIPVDVIEAILSKLPVKSLIRFQILSKLYRATISNPRFSKINHIHRSNRHDLFVRARSQSDHLTQFSLVRYSDGTEAFQTEAEFGIPFGDALPVCSCNGVVLVLPAADCSRLVLWNPSIRRHSIIGIPITPDPFRPFSFGLYHDSRTDDYKVVIISATCHLVFSCETRTWSEEELIPCTEENPMIVDGCFYWRREPGEIICYDLRERKIEKFKQPGNTGELFYLTALRGRLCVYPDEFGAEARVWVRENDGWREADKRGVHLCHQGPTVWYCCYALGFPYCFLPYGFSSFVTYNDCEKRYEERTEINSVNCKNEELVPYSESLFFPFEPGVSTL